MIQTTMDTATTTTKISSSASHHTVHDQHNELSILCVRLNDTDDQEASLQAARQMIANISRHRLEAQVLARVLELEHQLQQLEMAGND